MTKARSVVVVPGLAPLLDQQINQVLIPDNLSKLLTKSAFTPNGDTLESLLIKQFIETTDTSDLPVAQLRSQSQSHALCIDPVYLHADRDQLLLFSQGVELTDVEADQVINAIQPLFDQLKAKIKKVTPTQWIVELSEQPQLQFTAINHVEGKHIESFLPVGDKEQRDRWLRLFNEIQMTLFTLELNETRQQKGQLPINSVWFWGAGKPIFKQKAWDVVVGEHPLLTLLTQGAHIKTQKHIEQLDWRDNNFVCLPAFDWDSDVDIQLQALSTMLNSLYQQLKWGKFRQLTVVVPRHGSFNLSTLACWKIWK
jgi:hypothetical protein